MGRRSTIAFHSRPTALAIAFKCAAEPDGHEMIAVGLGDDPEALDVFALSPASARRLHEMLAEALVAPLPRLPS